MTIFADQTRKLLQASIDMIEKDREISDLKAQIAARDKRIAMLEGASQRSRLPFKRDLVPALLRRQAE
jgi:2-C-methyl-D-erythritol 4-phosphate cytidylyltransferase